MGAPKSLAGGFQVGLGAGHLATAIEVLRTFPFAERRGTTLIVREPIGVCGLITPWNWPMNQVAVPRRSLDRAKAAMASAPPVASARLSAHSG
jgi:acyl-CoA reductase-like NAD-dependent aldehyde dehydrogenase